MVYSKTKALFGWIKPQINFPQRRGQLSNTLQGLTKILGTLVNASSSKSYLDDSSNVQLMLNKRAELVVNH